jgi:hypothetical protein
MLGANLTIANSEPWPQGMLCLTLGANILMGSVLWCGMCQCWASSVRFSFF